MKFLPAMVLSIVMSVTAFSTNAFAGSNDPLFVNLTTNDVHRAFMALTFGRHQLDNGHHLTVFLNDHGVFLASKKYSRKYAREQKLMKDIVAKGGEIYVCDMCIHQFVIEESQLIPAVKVGHHDEASKALFEDHTKTLSW